MPEPAVAETVPSRPLRTWTWLPSAADIVCAVVAIAASYGAFQAVRHRLGQSPLRASTDIIGYNTLTNFNAKQYLQTFYAGAVGAPLLAIAVFVALRWTLGRVLTAMRPPPLPLLPPARRLMPPPVERVTAMTLSYGGWVRAAAFIAGPGIVLGVALAVERGPDQGSFWSLVAVGTALYGALVAALVLALHLAASRAERLRRIAPTIVAEVAVANSLGACLPVLGIWEASRVTTVTSGDGTIHHYDWLPLPVAVVVTLAAAGLVVCALGRRNTDGDRAMVVERRAVLLVAVPALVYLMLVRVWPPGAPFNVFEQGAQMATVQFIQQGMVPWRDFITDHGLFEDTLLSWMGTITVENTAWGMAANSSLIVLPLYYVVLTWFAYRVSASVAFTLFIVVLFFHQHAVTTLVRFIFWPLMLIVLWVTLERRHWWAAPLLGFVMVAFAVVTPEAAFCGFATGAALVLADLYRADLAAGRRLPSFAASGRMIAGALATLLLTVAILAALGALRGFVLYFQVASHDHALVGALPLLPWERPYSTWAVLPAVGVVLAILILAAKLWRRVVLSAEDFVMLAAALLTVVYYQKFTSRADLHVMQVYAAAIPLLIVVGHQLLEGLRTAMDQVVAGRRPDLPRLGGVAAVVALAIAVVTAPVDLRASMQTAALNVRAQTSMTTPTSTTLGWTPSLQPETSDPGIFLARYLSPGDTIYDMTNEPGLFYFALGYRPGARYFAIASAYSRAAQRDVIRDLQRTHPRIVVLYSGHTLGGLPLWDGVINEVRSYDVSQWVLDHYRPLAAVGDFLFYVDSTISVPDPVGVAPSLQEPLTTEGLPFHLLTCDWGYAPEFLNVEPPSDAPAVELDVTASASGTLTVQPPSGHAWADYHWLVVRTSASTFTTDSFDLRDGSDMYGEAHGITFKTLADHPSIYRFPIAACPQWHGYGQAPLELTHTSAQPVTVSLLP